MAKMPYVCLYSSYLDTLAPYSDEELGRIARAMMEYNAFDVLPNFDGNERFIWPSLKAQIDRDCESYDSKISRNRENGSKGGRPSKNPPVFPETEWFPEKPKKPKENDNENEKENENENDNENEKERVKADKPPAPAKSARKTYGEFGWVKLTEDEYNRLLNDLGEAEVKRCIVYVDESAQATGNKNKWRDWNLVLRKYHNQGWGLNQSGRMRPGANKSTGGRQLDPEEQEAIRRLLSDE